MRAVTCIVMLHAYVTACTDITFPFARVDPNVGPTIDIHVSSEDYIDLL